MKPPLRRGRSAYWFSACFSNCLRCFSRLDHIPFVIVGAQVAIKGDKSQASYGQVHLAELGNALFGELVKGHLALVRAPCNCEKAENCNR